jgi:hypothetical protein
VRDLAAGMEELLGEGAAPGGSDGGAAPAPEAASRQLVLAESEAGAPPSHVLPGMLSHHKLPLSS